MPGDESSNTSSGPKVSWGQATPFYYYCRPELRPRKVYGSWREYITELEGWLKQAQFWHGAAASFPYHYYMSKYPNRPGKPPLQNPFLFNYYSEGETQAPAASPTSTDPQFDGVECRIPAIWKRILAEFLDFLILFFLKLAVTFIAVDMFDIIDLDLLDLDMFSKSMKLEYKAVVQMTQEILILELVHRVIVCLYETCWLHGGLAGGGGSTPGKSIVGLRVILCNSIEPVTPVRVPRREELVVVRPGTGLTLGKAFCRSALKNLVIAFFFPASFLFFHYGYNRNAIDVLCSTVVVEEPLVRHQAPNRAQQ